MNTTVSSRKLLYRDIVICLSIILLPILFYLYKLVPESQNAVILGFELSTTHYADIQAFFWAISTKLLTLIAFCLWFLTCNHWWKFSLLVPTTIELYKLIGVLNDNQRFLDEFEFLTSLPFTIPLILILAFLSRKLNYYSLTDSMNSKIELDMNETLNQIFELKYSDFKNAKEKYEKLKENKFKMDKDEYLRQLVILKNEIKIG